MDERRPLGAILLFFILCSAVKDFEFLVLKTDQTFLAENIWCKLFCIGLIWLWLARRKGRWADLGFARRGMLPGMLAGFGLGAFTFALSYWVELSVLRAQGLHPALQLYITNFSLSSQRAAGLSASAVLLCILGNIANVWAEEGLFRGLFLRLGRGRFPFARANLLQALLFGLWHVITVVIWVLDGTLTIPAALAMALGYVLLAGILGYEWGLCVALTGTVWTGVFEHFFNNFIGNVLHTVTETGADELQILRIVLSNLLSLAIVGAIAFYKKRRPLKR